MEPELAQIAPVPHCSLESWLAEARALAKTGKCLNWDIGDCLLFKKRTFGDDAVSAAREATGWTHKYVSRVASIAERFPAGKRIPSVSSSCTKGWLRFRTKSPTRSFAGLPLRKFGARRLYLMACEMAGVDPADQKLGNGRNVSLPERLYLKLRECANGRKVSTLAQEIIEEWLVGEPVERKVSGPRGGAPSRALPC